METRGVRPNRSTPSGEFVHEDIAVTAVNATARYDLIVEQNVGFHRAVPQAHCFVFFGSCVLRERFLTQPQASVQHTGTTSTQQVCDADEADRPLPIPVAIPPRFCPRSAARIARVRCVDYRRVTSIDPAMGDCPVAAAGTKWNHPAARPCF
jgi:hypothetical protein